MNHTKVIKILLVLFAVVFCLGPVGLAGPVGTAFTYQGRLIDANNAADGLYDFHFKLFDAASDGNGWGPEVNGPNVDVIDGYFTVELNFGSVFDGNERWLDIGVRPGDLNDPNVYTVLSPRQKITPTPYAIYAKTADSISAGIDWIEIFNRPPGLDDGDQVGITSETDPTVLASVKDGITWTEVSNRPAGLDDGDQVGITSETDPQVGSNTTNYIPKWDGSALVSGTIYDNGNIGIGTSSPQASVKLEVRSTTIGGAAIAGYATGDDTIAVLGQSTNGLAGIYGISSDADYAGYFAGKVYVSGNVGIGTTNPGAKLEVNGPIKITDGSQGAGKVLTSDASGLASWQSPADGSETYYWSCVGAHFHPQYNDTSNTAINRDGAYIEAEADGIFFFAPVMLPDGARVTKVVVYGNATTEDWSFRRITLNSATMNVVESAKIGTEVTLSTPHTIDNNANAYVLWTSSLDTGNIIYNARITYTH